MSLFFFSTHRTYNLAKWLTITFSSIIYVHLLRMTVARSLPPSDYTHQIYMKPPPEYSTRACGSTNASQSDACVGNRPIDWHLYKANAILTNCPKKYTNFCPNAWVPSITLNAEEVRDTMSDFELFHTFSFLTFTALSTYFVVGWTVLWLAWWWAYKPS